MTDTEVLTRLADILDTMEHKDALRAERMTRLADVARRARAGELITDAERRSVTAPTVIDYGDVWDALRELAPDVRRLLGRKK